MNLLLFELKLTFRNKRLKQQFFLLLFMGVLFSFQVATSPLFQKDFLIKEFFLCMVFTIAANFATFALNINAFFIEKQLTIPMSIFEILRAKYLFFCISALILFGIFLTTILGGVKIIELVAAFLFAIGFSFFGLFLSSIFSYKPLVINESSLTNYQGSDANTFIFPLLVFALVFGVMALFYFIFNEQVTLIAMSVIGIFFIATHTIWLKYIANKLKETKYKRLEHFREQ